MLLAIIVVIVGCAAKPVDRDSELAVAAPCLSKPVFQEHPKLQVLLFSDKDHYRTGEPIKFRYEILWLGDGDARIYMNALAFPELEILYLNRKRVALQNAVPIAIRAKPGRHEIRTFAPTMKAVSEEFGINSFSKPVRFMNGMKGYYALEDPGAYVIRAKFGASSPWKISNKQEGKILSNAIVIAVGE